jgi:hypothetical protein
VCWRFPSCLVGQKRREKRPRQDSILNGAIKSVKKSSAGDSPFKYNKKQEEETRRNKKSQNGFLLVPSWGNLLGPLQFFLWICDDAGGKNCGPVAHQPLAVCGLCL